MLLESDDTEKALKKDEDTPSSEIVIGDVEQYDGRVVLYVIKGPHNPKPNPPPHRPQYDPQLTNSQRTKPPTSTT